MCRARPATSPVAAWRRAAAAIPQAAPALPGARRCARRLGMLGRSAAGPARRATTGAPASLARCGTRPRGSAVGTLDPGRLPGEPLLPLMSPAADASAAMPALTTLPLPETTTMPAGCSHLLGSVGIIVLRPSLDQPEPDWAAPTPAATHMQHAAEMQSATSRAGAFAKKDMPWEPLASVTHARPATALRLRTLRPTKTGVYACRALCSSIIRPSSPRVPALKAKNMTCEPSSVVGASRQAPELEPRVADRPSRTLVLAGERNWVVTASDDPSLAGPLPARSLPPWEQRPQLHHLLKRLHAQPLGRGRSWRQPGVP